MISSEWVSVTINFEPDRDFIKPSLTQQMAQIKSLGQKVMRHTCGAVRDLTTDVINLGVDISTDIDFELALDSLRATVALAKPADSSVRAEQLNMSPSHVQQVELLVPTPRQEHP